jgi:copper chaperone CopZ
VRSALLAVKGVTRATVTFEEHEAVVTYDPHEATVEGLITAVKQADGLALYTATIKGTAR